MKTVEEYLRHAGECDVLARTATSGEQREQIITMAATWRMLADQRRARILKEAAEAAASIKSEAVD